MKGEATAVAELLSGKIGRAIRFGALLLAVLSGIYACAKRPSTQLALLPSSPDENVPTKGEPPGEQETALAESQNRPTEESVRFDPVSDPIPTIEAPRLPEGLRVGVPREEFISGDRPLRVTHAEAAQRQAIIYLHGMCGNPKGADPWSDLAAKRGTLIVVRATIPCPNRPGYKWPKDPALIQARINAALLFVKDERGGQLDSESVLLIGYSQGAHRAERIAALSPKQYPFIVLGGAPTEPTSELLNLSQRVAILGGELEDTEHMEAGSTALVEAGYRARFFLLPRTGHGGYGPEGRSVMERVFTWLEQAN